MEHVKSLQLQLTKVGSDQDPSKETHKLDLFQVNMSDLFHLAVHLSHPQFRPPNEKNIYYKYIQKGTVMFLLSRIEGLMSKKHMPS